MAGVLAAGEHGTTRAGDRPSLTGEPIQGRDVRMKALDLMDRPRRDCTSASATAATISSTASATVGEGFCGPRSPERPADGPTDGASEGRWAGDYWHGERLEAEGEGEGQGTVEEGDGVAPESRAGQAPGWVQPAGQGHRSSSAIVPHAAAAGGAAGSCGGTSSGLTGSPVPGDDQERTLRLDVATAETSGQELRQGQGPCVGSHFGENDLTPAEPVLLYRPKSLVQLEQQLLDSEPSSLQHQRDQPRTLGHVFGLDHGQQWRAHPHEQYAGRRPLAPSHSGDSGSHILSASEGPSARRGQRAGLQHPAWCQGNDPGIKDEGAYGGSDKHLGPDVGQTHLAVGSSGQAVQSSQKGNRERGLVAALGLARSDMGRVGDAGRAASSLLRVGGAGRGTRERACGGEIFGDDKQAISCYGPGISGGQDSEDDRRQKRMLSNRESARRSRQRKQRKVEDMRGQASQLAAQNADMALQCEKASKSLQQINRENRVLRSHATELSRRLQRLNNVASTHGHTPPHSAHPSHSVSASPWQSMGVVPPPPLYGTPSYGCSGTSAVSMYADPYGSPYSSYLGLQHANSTSNPYAMSSYGQLGLGRDMLGLDNPASSNAVDLDPGDDRAGVGGWGCPTAVFGSYLAPYWSPESRQEYYPAAGYASRSAGRIPSGAPRSPEELSLFPGRLHMD